MAKGITKVKTKADDELTDSNTPALASKQDDIISNQTNGTQKTQVVNSLGDEGTCLVDCQTGKTASIESLGSLKTITPIRLAGTAFSGMTKDTNFWTETVTGSGSVTQAGDITLSTGTTADSTVKYETVRKSRKITGKTNQFRSVARNIQAPAADCIRRIGPYDANNGFLAQFDGTTFEFRSRKGGVDTVVQNGSFNGNGGATIDFGGGISFTRVEIEYTALSAKLTLDGTLIHTIRATTTSLTNTLDLPVTIELINENGNTTNNSYEVLFATIVGLGELKTSNQFKYIDGAATTICKYGAGTLKRIAVTDTSGDITVYDNTAASGTIITVIDPSKTSGTIEYNAPFNNGLTIVTTASTKATIIYE